MQVCKKIRGRRGGRITAPNALWHELQTAERASGKPICLQSPIIPPSFLCFNNKDSLSYPITSCLSPVSSPTRDRYHVRPGETTSTQLHNCRARTATTVENVRIFSRLTIENDNLRLFFFFIAAKILRQVSIMKIPDLEMRVAIAQVWSWFNNWITSTSKSLLSDTLISTEAFLTPTYRFPGVAACKWNVTATF